jgi:cytochrome c oxidase subunit 4
MASAVEETRGEHPAPSKVTGGHPSERQYVVVALILGAVTLAEVGLYYIELAKLPMVLLLLALAAVKFAIVALWFMHLRFDSRLFRRLFIVGIVLAIGVYTIALLTFGVFLEDRTRPSARTPTAEGSQ